LSPKQCWRRPAPIFTNKYAEGYPGRRYYGGCEYADVVENLARDRAKQIFGGEHINVQPHSGSQANASAYAAVLQAGDTILGLDLAHGGHLTHGHKLSFSGKLYRPTFYQVRRDTELIDYDELEAIAEREKPKAIIGGGSAYPRLWDFARMRQIADKVGAVYIFDMAHIAGLVAGGVHPSPVPHAHITTTTTHKTLRGPRAGLIICGQGSRQRPSTRQSFPASRAARSCTSSPPRRWPLRGAAAGVPHLRRADRGQRQGAGARPLQEAGFRIVSGGTDNHLMLVDVFQKGILGSEAELALGKAGITVNKNSIPYDTNPPLKPSGIRVGTPALTTRGMKEPEMRRSRLDRQGPRFSATTMRRSSAFAAKWPSWPTSSRSTPGGAPLTTCASELMSTSSISECNLLKDSIESANGTVQLAAPFVHARIASANGQPARISHPFKACNEPYLQIGVSSLSSPAMNK
jgi:glycine hydroxymethyltransferase